MKLVNSSLDEQTCDCGYNPCPQWLAMATIPMQIWEQPYEPSRALSQGTIFPGLDKPFFATDMKLGGGRVG